MNPFKFCSTQCIDVFLKLRQKLFLVCKELTYLTLFWTEEEANLSFYFFVNISTDLLQTYYFCAKFISAHFLKISSCFDVPLVN